MQERGFSVEQNTCAKFLCGNVAINVTSTLVCVQQGNLFPLEGHHFDSHNTIKLAQVGPVESSQ